MKDVELLCNLTITKCMLVTIKCYVVGFGSSILVLAGLNFATAVSDFVV